MALPFTCSHCGQTGWRSADNFMLCTTCEPELRAKGLARQKELIDREIVGRGIKQFLTVAENVAAELRGLHLDGSATDTNLQALAESPRLSYLDSLAVQSSGLGPSTCRALGQSPFIGNLGRLDLSGNPLGDQGIAELAASTQLSRLTDLNLRATHCGDAGLSALAASQHLDNLRGLHLGDNEIGDDGARRLVSSPLLARLTHLALGNRITDSGVRCLAASDALGNLVSLDLHDNRIGDEAAVALAASAALGHLKRLDLTGTQVGSAGTQAIAASVRLPRLREIRIPLYNLDLAAMRALTHRFDNVFPGFVESPKVQEQEKQTRPTRQVREALLWMLAHTENGNEALLALGGGLMPLHFERRVSLVRAWNHKEGDGWHPHICSTQEMIRNILYHEEGDKTPRQRDGSLQITVYDDCLTWCQTKVFSQTFVGTVDLGRKRDDKEVMYAGRKDGERTRVVIARVEESSVSRDHARIEPLPDGRVRITNTSSALNIHLANSSKLSPGAAAEESLPTLMALGTRMVCLDEVWEEEWEGGSMVGVEVRDWAGRLQYYPSLSEPSPGGHVADQGSWTRLWSDWRGDEPEPEIDFANELILFDTTAVGQASTGLEYHINRADGNLEFLPPKSLFQADSSSFGYWIKVIPRVGIRSIKGQPLRSRASCKILSASTPGWRTVSQEPPITTQVKCTHCSQTRLRSANNSLYCEGCEREMRARGLARLKRSREWDFVGRGIKRFLSVAEDIAAGLRELHLDGSANDTDLQALAESPRFSNLPSLALRFCGLGASSCRAVAQSPFVGNLIQLDLSGNQLGDRGIEELATALHMGRLTALALRATHCGDVGLAALAASQHLDNLCELDLGANEIGDDGVRVLAGSPLLARLERLALGNRITSSGVRCLAEAATVGNLDSLYLYGTHIGDEGAVALASSAALPHLEHLDLTGTRVGKAGGHALASTPNLPSLRELGFPLHDLDLEVMRVLSHRFGNIFPGSIQSLGAMGQDQQPLPAWEVREAQLWMVAHALGGERVLVDLWQAYPLQSHELYKLCAIPWPPDAGALIGDILDHEYGRRIQIKVYDRRQELFRKAFTGVVNLGRQRDGKEVLYAPCKASERTRVAIARLDEDTVSRDHARIERLPENRVRITNISAKVSIRLEDGTELNPGVSTERTLPATLYLGHKAVRLKEGGDSNSMGVKDWAGRHTQYPSLIQQTSSGGHVADQSSWTHLWRTWRATQEKSMGRMWIVEEPVPEVDFKSELVLIHTTAVGQASSGLEFQINSSDGNLEFLPPKSLFKADSNTFGYWIKVVPRAGIRSVKGQPLAEPHLSSPA